MHRRRIGWRRGLSGPDRPHRLVRDGHLEDLLVHELGQPAAKLFDHDFLGCAGLTLLDLLTDTQHWRHTRFESANTLERRLFDRLAEDVTSLRVANDHH